MRSLPRSGLSRRQRFLGLAILVSVMVACQLPITISRIPTITPTLPFSALNQRETSTPFMPQSEISAQNPLLVNTPGDAAFDASIASITGTGTSTGTPFSPSPTISTGTVSPTNPSETTAITTPTTSSTQTMTWVAPSASPTRTATFPVSTRTATIYRTPTTTRTPAPPTATWTASATTNATLVVPTGPVTPAQLIAAVNQLRVANGFPALIVHPILMGTAQWTAETMAANHYLDHLAYLGYPGVRTRIAAAGYGPCASVWATENWAMGYRTLEQIMVAWSDPAHMLPMTQSYYVHIGAGVATGPWGPYYIVHAAYWVGTTCAPSSTSTPTATRTFTTVPPTSTQSPTQTMTLTEALPPTQTVTPTETPVPPTETESVCSASGNYGFESTLIELINQERINQGLTPLIAQSQLTNAARSHSQDMGCNNIFSHTGSDGSSPFDRIAWQGYSFTTAAENIYAGSGPYDSPQEAFNAWMNSPGHRDNMLNPVYTDIGIGYSYNPASTYGGYFTAVFAKP